MIFIYASSQAALYGFHFANIIGPMLYKDYLRLKHNATFADVFSPFLTQPNNSKLLKYLDLIWLRPVSSSGNDTFHGAA